ncbi:hypothetical protein DERP_003870 [Dermatophagoides pteronyssinus]|uniref:Uncharacterized protein n=1 Tax=Dermatophagoides pteronyssinus TaxID=6956 RepID=A0ABQ8J805_DERPT|nr:hypothetical protein DERP_003870 [Dermatophagoides pteronyssinus]
MKSLNKYYHHHDGDSESSCDEFVVEKNINQSNNNDDEIKDSVNEFETIFLGNNSSLELPSTSTSSSLANDNCNKILHHQLLQQEQQIEGQNLENHPQLMFIPSLCFP